MIADPDTTIDEGLALTEEMAAFRPGMKAILLAPSSAPRRSSLRCELASLSASAPLRRSRIASFAYRAATDSDWRTEIEVLSAQPDWVSLRANCSILTAERVVTFLGELHAELPEAIRDKLMLAFREILLGAMGHAEASDRHKVVEVSAVRTERTIVFYVRDPGTGLRRATLAHATAARAAGPTASIEQAAEMGIRPGGFATLLDRGVVDELIYSETGNEVLMIKHTA